LWEFRTAEGEEYSVGQSISVEIFAEVKKVDVTGTPVTSTFLTSAKISTLML
jgi:large subunit ribosomal protein L3